jgi:hypothetical protein
MDSDNPTGADDQQGSRPRRASDMSPIPQRLHAELLATCVNGLEAYLQGALRDGTRSARHRTHRIGQSDPGWLHLLRIILDRLGRRAWIYREGAHRSFWVLETTAAFLSLGFDARPFIGTREGLDFVRGYFDADGGMPRSSSARLYLQYTQKDRADLEIVSKILESWNIKCGRIHNPSAAVDPDYWRFFVRRGSHERFISLVGSWHPRKRKQIANRMKI